MRVCMLCEPAAPWWWGRILARHGVAFGQPYSLSGRYSRPYGCVLCRYFNDECCYNIAKVSFFYPLQVQSLLI